MDEYTLHLPDDADLDSLDGAPIYTTAADAAFSEEGAE